MRGLLVLMDDNTDNLNDVIEFNELMLDELSPKKGRGRPSGPRQFNVTSKNRIELFGRHFEILRLHVIGTKSIDIAKQLELTPECVSQVINSPVAQAHLKTLQGRADKNVTDLKKRFDDTALDAQELLEETMNNPNEETKIRVQIAQSQLDRAGHSPPKKIEVRAALGIFDVNDIINMKKDAGIDIKAHLKDALESGNLV